MDMLLRAFFGLGEFFVWHFSLCCLVSRSYSGFVSCYYFIQELRVNYDSSQQIWANFQLVLFFPRISFWAPVSKSLLKFYELHFIQDFWFWNYPHTQFDSSHKSTFPTFTDEVGLPERGIFLTFSRPSSKSLCILKTIFLDRLASSKAFFIF